MHTLIVRDESRSRQLPGQVTDYSFKLYALLSTGTYWLQVQVLVLVLVLAMVTPELHMPCD